jgi:hypothetical protein
MNQTETKKAILKNDADNVCTRQSMNQTETKKAILKNDSDNVQQCKYVQLLECGTICEIYCIYIHIYRVFNNTVTSGCRTS